MNVDRGGGKVRFESEGGFVNYSKSHAAFLSLYVVDMLLLLLFLYQKINTKKMMVMNK